MGIEKILASVILGSALMGSAYAQLPDAPQRRVAKTQTKNSLSSTFSRTFSYDLKEDIPFYNHLVSEKNLLGTYKGFSLFSAGRFSCEVGKQKYRATIPLYATDPPVRRRGKAGLTLRWNFGSQ